ncbi:MAG: NAD(P)H-binding protein [Pleurocapsa sp. SU_196_0]|nr:NAD(P)H-binding protein [Pleurocapsa sp. SU_196_0]
MNIVVFGATGDTGLEIVKQGLERGHRLVAFVRDPARLTQKHERLSIRAGNVLEPDSLSDLFDKTSLVISALGVRLGQPVDETRSRGTRNIVQAMSRQGVKRFVSVSTIGVGDSLVYHFSETSTKRIRKNDGRRQFLLADGAQRDCQLVVGAAVIGIEADRLPERIRGHQRRWARRDVDRRSVRQVIERAVGRVLHQPVRRGVGIAAKFHRQRRRFPAAVMVGTRWNRLEHDAEPRRRAASIDRRTFRRVSSKIAKPTGYALPGRITLSSGCPVLSLRRSSTVQWPSA